MPQHAESLEAQSLLERWDDWSRQYSGRWIAIRGDRVIASDEDGDRLVETIGAEFGAGALVARMADFDTEIG